MYLSFYNKNYVGDVLLLLKKETTDPVLTETKNNITRIYDEKTNETVAFNIFNISKYINLSQLGHILLTDEQSQVVNDLLQKNDFETIKISQNSNFVIGFVEECIDHPDSDHLHITKVNVGDEVLQIVCGASNVAQGQYVVVAKVGAVMPNGMLIVPGSLRGVDSNGMLCSERELALTTDMTKKGILILEHGEIGASFKTGSIY